MPRSTPLTAAERIELWGILREARARVLGDAEGFQAASASLERVGQVLSHELKQGLGGYKEALQKLSCDNPACNPETFDRLFKLVKDARNDAVHEGAYARHMSSRLIDLIILLEDAISSTMRTLEDVMVRNPITSESWHLVAHLRNAMLANSFSFIPYCNPVGARKEWMLISDTSVMELLKPWKGRNTELLQLTVQEAVEKHDLRLVKANCFEPEMTIDLVAEKLKDGPVLIVKRTGEEEHLLGILTAFDLL